MFIIVFDDRCAVSVKGLYFPMNHCDFLSKCQPLKIKLAIHCDLEFLN